jgi:septum formation protein
VSFTVCPSDVEELAQGDPSAVALENALRKARAVREQTAGPNRAEAKGQVEAEVAGGGVGVFRDGMEIAGGGEVITTVLGVDTLVALDEQIYGKPADEHHARSTLRALGGRTHQVFSGLALLAAGEERTAVVSTAVSFRELDEPLLDWYLATGEWEGRAGGYAIQGAGAVLVRSVNGDYENVVGLPLARLLDLYPQLLKACK